MNNYARALSALKNLLPETALQEFEVLEARMLENLHHERLYGGTPDTSAARFSIVGALNQLSWQYKTKSFTELCFHPQTIKISADTAASTNSNSSSVDSQQGSKKVVAPKAHITCLNRVLPSAYYHLLNAQDFPFFQVIIDNSDPDGDDVSLAVSAFIEDHSDVAKTTVDVARGTRKEIALLPVLKHRALVALNEIRKVTLQISVRQISPYTTEIQNTTEAIHLMARNYALVAIRGRDQHITDLTKYLVAWVTPNHSEISSMLRLACDHHSLKEFRGYRDGETIEETATSVREQARAIFFSLKYKAELAYVNSTLQWDMHPEWITQKVRLPGECLGQSRIANCLDGTVLFASLLELIGIEPQLVLVPGHAFVGWRIEHDVDQYEFLDTMMIGTADFDQAQAHASMLYNQAVKNNDFERELFAQPGFARLIDVVRYRREGIYPLE